MLRKGLMIILIGFALLSFPASNGFATQPEYGGTLRIICPWEAKVLGYSLEMGPLDMAGAFPAPHSFVALASNNNGSARFENIVDTDHIFNDLVIGSVQRIPGAGDYESLEALLKTSACFRMDTMALA